MTLKQTEVKQKTIGDYTYYIKPFAAFVSANLSGELAGLISPLLGALAPLLGEDDKDIGDIMEMDVSNIAPAISAAFSTLSGDKIESLMKKLLVTNGNISLEGPITEGETVKLTYDLANEVFCGDVQDMFILCAEVIKLNFKGFFKKLGGQFGSLREVIQNLSPATANTESST